MRLGYVVIFLYRPGTACPFARSFQGELSEHVDAHFLDALKAREKTGSILLDLERGQANPLLAALKGYQQAVEEGSLLLVTYE